MNEPAVRSLEYWASVQGRAPALIEGETVLTWSDWNDYANLLAQTLDNRGIGHGDIVGLRTRTRMEWAVIAAAISKVEARLLPIDRRMAPLAVRDALIQSGACALFVDDTRPGELGKAIFGLPMRLRASIDVDAPGFMPFTDLFPPVAPPRYAAGLPPQCGSASAATGGVKGIALDCWRMGAGSRVQAPRNDMGVSLVSVCLASLTGYRQVMSALNDGRSLVFLRRFTPQAAMQAVQRHAVTEWTLTTTTSLRMAELPSDALAIHDLSSLKKVSAVTKPIDMLSKARLVQALGPVVFENQYAGEAEMTTAPANELGKINDFRHGDTADFLHAWLGRAPHEEGRGYIAGTSADDAQRPPAGGDRAFTRPRLHS